jgi:uncharacterized membrane protein YfcA
LVKLDLPAATVAMVAAAIGAGAQAVAGFGFALVAAPVFVQIVGPARAVRLTNLLAVAVNLLLLAREWRVARLSVALRLLVPAVLVTPVVAYAVHRTTSSVLSVIVGSLIVVSALALASGRRAERLRGWTGMLAAGGVSAAMNTASGVGGPAVAMYALNAGWSPEMMRPTLQLYFIGLNLLSFLSLGAISVQAGTAAGLAVAVVAGFAIGTTLGRRLSPAAVGRAVLVLSLTGGVAAVLRGLLDL